MILSFIKINIIISIKYNELFFTNIITATTYYTCYIGSIKQSMQGIQRFLPYAQGVEKGNNKKDDKKVDPFWIKLFNLIN